MRQLDPRGGGRLCVRFVSALPVQHAAISTLGPPFELETVCSSDPLAAALDRLQLDYGEGPCWDARETRAPILLPDLLARPSAGWPVLHQAIASHEIRAAYAFPMSVGSLNVGAVDLYSTSPDAMSTENVATATTMAAAAAVVVLRDAMSHLDDSHRDDPSSRRIVHQATGMVIAQLRIPAAEALLVLRAHAFAIDGSVADVAAEVVARRLDFSE